MNYYTVCPTCGYKLLKASDGSNILCGSSPTIRIERKDDKDIFINFQDSEETTKLYKELQLKI